MNTPENKKTLQELFKFIKVHSRIIFTLFNFRVSFLLPHKKRKNYYISLGTNCYARVMLSKIGIKPRKKDGELTCPFDLCWTSCSSIAQILENGFADYLDFIETTEEKSENTGNYFYLNKKYNITYVHDDDLDTIEKLKHRYEKRIQNFLEISKNQNELVYMQFIFGNKFVPEDLNRIYNSLSKIRNDKPFKYAVFSFTDKYSNTKKLLNPDIIYNEYIPECGTETYTKDWHLRDRFWADSILKQLCNDVCQL